jgi:hypothetical protein
MRRNAEHSVTNSAHLKILMVFYVFMPPQSGAG